MNQIGINPDDQNRMMNLIRQTEEYWARYLGDPEYGPQREQLLKQYLEAAPMATYDGLNWCMGLSVQSLHQGVPVPRPAEKDPGLVFKHDWLDIVSRSMDSQECYNRIMNIQHYTMIYYRHKETWLDRLKYWLASQWVKMKRMLKESRLGS